MVEVQSDGIFQVVQQQSVLGPVGQHLADVYTVRKQQHWLRTQRLAAALVRPQLIALHTPALEPSLCVGTALAAVALLCTLIHILAGPAVLHQSVASMTGTLDQTSGHLTLLRTASVIQVTVALAGPWAAVLVRVFVRPISTVADLITDLPLANTSAVTTQELVWSTRRGVSLLTVIFIAAIRAVILAITSP